MKSNLSYSLKSQLSKSNIVKDSYKGMSSGTTRNTFTFKNFRDELKNKRAFILEDIAKYEAEVKRINTEYRPVIAKQKISELKMFSDSDAEINKTIKDSLRDDLKTTLDAKRDRLTKFVCKEPTAQQMNLLQTISMRKGTLSDAELELILPVFADNCMALTTLQTITARADGMYSFSLPFDVDASIKALDEIEQGFNIVIDNIDKPDADLPYRAYAILNRDGITDSFTALMSELDSDFSFNEPDTRTVLEKLKDTVAETEADFLASVSELRENNTKENAEKTAKKLAKNKQAEDFLNQHESVLKTDADADRERIDAEIQALEFIKNTSIGEE